MRALRSHAISSGCYLSHLAVAHGARRRGLGRALLRRCELLAAELAAEPSDLNLAAERSEPQEPAIWLHVEKTNGAAIALYESEGYELQPESHPYVGFTNAMKLQHRDPALYHKAVV